jgi:hypothetical protein
MALVVAVGVRLLTKSDKQDRQCDNELCHGSVSSAFRQNVREVHLVPVVENRRSIDERS